MHNRMGSGAALAPSPPRTASVPAPPAPVLGPVREPAPPAVPASAVAFASALRRGRQGGGGTGTGADADVGDEGELLDESSGLDGDVAAAVYAAAAAERAAGGGGGRGSLGGKDM